MKRPKFNHYFVICMIIGILLIVLSLSNVFHRGFILPRKAGNETILVPPDNIITPKESMDPWGNTALPPFNRYEIDKDKY